MVRTCAAFAGAGCAFAFAYRGDWAVAGWAAGGVLLAVVFWVCGELAAVRATMQGQPAAGRHRRRGVVASALRTTAGMPRRVLSVVGLW